VTQAGISVFTSAARNYLPKVRVLFDSVERHHPEWRRVLVLAERSVVPGDLEMANAQEVRCVPDLGVPDWEPWSFCHTLVELATAIKPFALSQLLAEEGVDRVVYLDPDVALFSRLDEIITGLEQASILLTPHQLLPEATLGRVIDNEISSLRHGVYNLGFVAVSDDAVGRAFAEWWSQRLYHFCRDDWRHGLFTDQKWIDLVPALFPAVGVVRSARFNVASWILSERNLEGEGELFLVDGEPLGFYHFTSASSDSHELMALKNSENPEALVKLLRWYRDQERQLASANPGIWSFACYSDGGEIADEHRALFRDNASLQGKYADPYAADGFADWLRRMPEPLAAEQTPAALTVVSPGYVAGRQLVDGAKVVRLLKAMVANPGSLAMVTKRVISILDQEGVRGIVRRLR
jgi:hypothetical protein